jgi:acetyl esterase/lipase
MPAGFDQRIRADLRGGLALLDTITLKPGDLADPAATAHRLRAAGPGAHADVGRVGPTVVAVHDARIARPGAGDHLEVRIFRPCGSVTPLPAVIYLHGGGMIRGSIDREHSACAELAETVGAVVVAVAYRLAPEHPFPAAVDDVYLALSWLAGGCAPVPLDPGNIAITGGSAGGGLAVAAALMARDRNGPAITHVAVVSPMLDDRTALSFTPEFSGTIGWNTELNRFAWSCVLGPRAGTEDVSPYAAPARADDLTNLPPIFMQIGQEELFRDEDLAFAHRLVRARVPVELHVYPGAYHGWETLNAHVPLAAESRNARLRSLRDALHPAKGHPG